MSVPRVGWYVHHHGNGHLARFLAVRPHLDASVTVFSSLPRPASLPARTGWIELPLDSEPQLRDGLPVDPADSQPTAHGRLHWAPVGHAGHRARLVQIASAAPDLDAFVVDVSVEVALLVRLLGLPLALFTQPGRRDDAPHRLAFELADVVIRPWPAGLHGGVAADRSVEVGGITRHAGRARLAPVAGRVLLLGGIGSAEHRVVVWDALRRGAPELDLRSAGYLPGTFAADVWDEICQAEVVISAAGQNSVADIAAAGRRVVLVPQPRPFDEQHATASALAAAGVAEVVDAWPAPGIGAAAGAGTGSAGRELDVSAVLDAVTHARARVADPDWTAWDVGAAAARAAALIRDLRP